MSDPILQQLTKATAGGVLAPPPSDAIVLRGYRMNCPAPPVLVKLEASPGKNATSGPPLPAGTAKNVQDALNTVRMRRLYLSARFDKYVDYSEDDELATMTPTPDDGSVIVWLRSTGAYTLVTEVPLNPGAPFVRGQLIDDFLSQPDAQSVWSEQSYATGKTGTGRNCYYGA